MVTLLLGHIGMFNLSLDRFGFCNPRLLSIGITSMSYGTHWSMSYGWPFNFIDWKICNGNSITGPYWNDTFECMNIEQTVPWTVTKIIANYTCNGAKIPSVYHAAKSMNNMKHLPIFVCKEYLMKMLDMK